MNSQNQNQPGGAGGVREQDFGGQHVHYPQEQQQHYTTVPLNGGGAIPDTARAMYPPGEKIEDGSGSGSGGRGRKVRSGVFGAFSRNGSHTNAGGWIAFLAPGQPLLTQC